MIQDIADRYHLFHSNNITKYARICYCDIISVVEHFSSTPCCNFSLYLSSPHIHFAMHTDHPVSILFLFSWRWNFSSDLMSNEFSTVLCRVNEEVLNVGRAIHKIVDQCYTTKSLKRNSQFSNILLLLEEIVITAFTWFFLFT
jgi:hypothetical protein